jgi:hypothetical protein
MKPYMNSRQIKMVELTDDELLAQIDSELAALTDLEVAKRAFETTKGLWLVATKKCIEKDKEIEDLTQQLEQSQSQLAHHSFLQMRSDGTLGEGHAVYSIDEIDGMREQVESLTKQLGRYKEIANAAEKLISFDGGALTIGAVLAFSHLKAALQDSEVTE